MCGLVGSYGYTAGEARIDMRLSRIAHRGPDAEGLFSHETRHGPLILGHRRLSIIDVSSAANQPMIRDDLVLVFNGEIYNFRELRAELAGHGYRFSTNSDTEVILHGWRHWGTGMLRWLRGMFAFAIFDRRTEELFLARDHFGIKPLYFIEDRSSRRLVFSSELRAISDLAPGGGELSALGLCASLLYVWLPDDVSILQGVQKLQAGEVARFHPAEGLSVSPYWRKEELLAQSQDLTVEGLSEILEASIAAHMIADVPVGAFLSGGLDSSLICAIAAQRSAQLKCFSIGYAAEDGRAEAMPDDLKYARMLSAQRGFKLHEIVAAPDVSSSTVNLSRVMDEPIGDAAAIHVLTMCDAAQQHGVKVLLSGMGGDEIFGGYRRHQAALYAAAYRRVPRPLRNVISQLVDGAPVSAGGRGRRYTRWAKRFLSFANKSEASAYLRSYTYFELDGLDALTRGQFSQEIASLAERHADAYALANGGKGKGDQIRRMCMTDLQMFLPGLNLAYTDRASMAASTEVRVPYVDMEVIKASYRLNPSEFIKWGQPKALLKKAAERYLPRPIIYRPKANFGAPLRSWTRGQLREIIHDSLPNGRLVRDGYIDGRLLGGILEANDRGLEDHAQLIWHLLTLEIWLRENLSHRSTSDRDLKAQ